MQNGILTPLLTAVKNPMTLEAIRTFASLAAVVGVILAWWQLKLLRKQARTTFEDRLTEQYRKIMEDIPTDIWLKSELKALDDKDQRGRCRDAIYRYIDLSQEEAFLYDQKRITKNTWEDWWKGIEANMQLPAFKEVWEEVIKNDSNGFQELKNRCNMPPPPSSSDPLLMENRSTRGAAASKS